MPDSPAAAHLGACLRATRIAEHITQKTAAELSGISERTLRDIENGRHSPSLGAVLSFAETLGLTLKAER